MEDLKEKWDIAAAKIDFDPMRPIRYGMALRYIVNMDREINMLEVGCGEGTGLFFFNRLGFEKLSGVEVSRERIERAKSKLPGSILLKEIEPDAQLPFENGEFDLVLSLAVIEHTVSPEKFIAEISRVLKESGYAVISSDCLTWSLMQALNLYKSEQPIDNAIPIYRLKKIFESSGLDLIHFDTFHLPERKSPFFSFLKKITNRIFHRNPNLLKKYETYSIEDEFQAAQRISKINIRDSLSFRIKKHLLNVIDDENIFLVRKI